MGDKNTNLYDILKDFYTNSLESIIEGKGKGVDSVETDSYKGICIFENGHTLLNELIENEAIDRNDIHEKIYLNSVETWNDFLSNRRDKDGVYIYESSEKTLYRIGEIVINATKIRYGDLLPYDFNKFGCDVEKTEQEMRENLGTKTRLALRLTKAYPDVKAYILKRGKYDPETGAGKVVQFGQNGIEKEFFITGENDGYYGTSREYQSSPRLRTENRELLRSNSNIDMENIGSSMIECKSYTGIRNEDLYRQVGANYLEQYKV